jgi:hypothetical protein
MVFCETAVPVEMNSPVKLYCFMELESGQQTLKVERKSLFLFAQVVLEKVA